MSDVQKHSVELPSDAPESKPAAGAASTAQLRSWALPTKKHVRDVGLGASARCSVKCVITRLLSKTWWQRQHTSLSHI